MIHAQILPSHQRVEFSKVPAAGCSNPLQHATKFESIAVFSQLSALTEYAEELFGNLLDEVQHRDERVQDASQNLQSLRSRLPDLEAFAVGREPWDFHVAFEVRCAVRPSVHVGRADSRAHDRRRLSVVRPSVRRPSVRPSVRPSMMIPPCARKLQI